GRSLAILRVPRGDPPGDRRNRRIRLPRGERAAAYRRTRFVAVADAQAIPRVPREARARADARSAARAVQRHAWEAAGAAIACPQASGRRVAAARSTRA